MPEVMPPTVSPEDARDAVRGDFCPWCAADAPVRSLTGPRRRCRACLARWEQDGDLVTPTWSPVRSEAAPTPLVPGQLKVTVPRRSLADRVEEQVIRFRRERGERCPRHH